MYFSFLNRALLFMQNRISYDFMVKCDQDIHSIESVIGYIYTPLIINAAVYSITLLFMSMRAACCMIAAHTYSTTDPRLCCSQHAWVFFHNKPAVLASHS